MFNPEPAESDLPQSFRARWVFPVSGPPLENATVEVSGGRISAVHTTSNPRARDLGNCAIIPGLVNAHTHLELSDVAVPLNPAQPFTAWLKEVMLHRRNRLGPDVPAMACETIDRGIEEAKRFGTTTIGDIAGPASAPEIVSDIEQPPPARPRTLQFLELIGLTRERRDEQLHRGRVHLADESSLADRPFVNGPVIRGLSPHAPFSVHPDLFRGIVDLAVARTAPIAMHLAETRAELQLLVDGAGPFVTFLEELGVWRPDAIPRGSRPLDYLRELARAQTALAIHGNYLADDEQEFLAAHPNVSVVYCPRTHAFFGHSEHPWRSLLERGVNVALGTDSRASNPDLSLWNELIFLRRAAPDLDPAVLLRLGSLNGAISLGLGDETGTLEVGKSADLAFVKLAAGDSTDPYELLFRRENRIAATMCAGRI